MIPLVKQPVFLRSMSAPSDLEMIANQDLEFTHAPQRYFCYFFFNVKESLNVFFNLSCINFQKKTPPVQSSQQLIYFAAVSGRRGQPGQAHIQRAAGTALCLHWNYTRSGCMLSTCSVTNCIVLLITVWSNLFGHETCHISRRCPAAAFCRPHRHDGGEAARGSRH